MDVEIGPLANAWVGLLGDDFGVEQAGFDGPHAADAPTGCDHLFDDIDFGGGDGLMDGVKFVKDFVELIRVLAIEEDVAAAGGKAMFEGIARRFFFAFSGGGAARLGAVGAGGVGFELRYHSGSPNLILP